MQPEKSVHVYRLDKVLDVKHGEMSNSGPPRKILLPPLHRYLLSHLYPFLPLVNLDTIRSTRRASNWDHYIMLPSQISGATAARRTSALPRRASSSAVGSWLLDDVTFQWKMQQDQQETVYRKLTQMQAIACRYVLEAQ